MQTQFSTEDLQKPVFAEAEKILHKCVHCGFCTATCSSYVIQGDERDSPRGRIYMIKEMFENGGTPDKNMVTHIDRCLSCLSCVTTCPSRVDYMHLIDLSRTHIEKNFKRPIKQRLIRKTLSAILPYPRRMKIFMRLGLLGKPFQALFPKIGLKEIGAMLSLMPLMLPRSGKYTSGTFGRKSGHKQLQKQQKKVIVIPGCASSVLRPSIHDAAVIMLLQNDIQVIIPEKSGCCGALDHHIGQEKASLEMAKTMVNAIAKEMEFETIDAVLVTASGCGTQVKDFGHIFKNEPGYSSRGQEIADITQDITEYLSELTFKAPTQWSDLKVAYHSACSMQHGQNVNEAPRKLLKRAGYNIVEIPEGHLCCGSAGTYNILQKEIADQLLERKIKNINHVKPDLIATGNIGCITQIASGTDIPIVHTAELINWAYGGNCPKELLHLKKRTHKVKDFIYAEATE